MVPFAGYEMPVRYSSDIEEHMVVRQAVGIFDVSHMGEFTVKGPAALELIQRATSNDASKLTAGKVQYSCLPNDTGGIVDDLLVYCRAEGDYLLVVNASNIGKDWARINELNTGGAELENISEQISLLAVQGPKAGETLQRLTEVVLDEMKYYTFTTGKFAGKSEVIVSATGYTGSGGFELYIKNEEAAEIWEAVMTAGETFGIKPAGLGARDTLRLEAGFCLYGNDIDDSTSVIEAGLGWITKFTKDFASREIFEKHKSEGSERKLVGFKLTKRGIPRTGYLLRDAEGKEIGKVTSGTQSPMLKQGIGLGYVKKEFSKKGTPIFVEIRNKSVAAEVCRPPFVNLK